MEDLDSLIDDIYFVYYIGIIQSLNGDQHRWISNGRHPFSRTDASWTLFWIPMCTIVNTVFIARFKIVMDSRTMIHFQVQVVKQLDAKSRMERCDVL